ncbi:MAG: DUF3488 and transglutaminase-like domain-containing protein [Kangiella sp.]|nr:DUF3488 and transglutaminase-like domain-containing protein [Kangiella sp.]MCW9029571.1 DUF3488 and transglutaminase-like domain-containing protein [Kangiella sp.]
MNTQLLPLTRPGVIPLLILVQAIVLLPLWFYLPAWISISTVALLCIRFVVYKKKIKLPSWLILILALCALGGVFVYFRTISGREAGVGLISLMYTFKLLEAKNYRDGALILFISFFILVTAFLYDESILMGFYLFASIMVILMGLIALNSLKGVEGIRQIGKTSGVALLQALPIMLILFFLFPRLSGPLWAMPSQRETGLGIDDEMIPGSMAGLYGFDEIAFRVDFEDASPPISQMYWRGLVLSKFNGIAWTRGTESLLRSEDYPVGEPTYAYRVQLEANNRHWIFGLEDLIEPPNQQILLFNNYTWRNSQRVTQRQLYSAQSYDIDYSNTELSEWQIQTNTELPDNGNQETKEWAINEYERAGEPKEFVRFVLSYIRQQNYHYTLLPKIIEQNVIDGFWFGSREGYCEHYASAFVFIMRAAGIPARVVTGYQGGEYNPYGDYYIVRQKDAHAWTEVWLEGEGWRRVDPTAAIHPSRVDDSLLNQTSSRDDWFTDFDSLSDRENSELARSLLEKISLRWDAMQSFWNETVMGYDRDIQLNWLSKLGINNDQWRYLGYALLATILFTGAGFGLWILGQAKSRDKVESAYRQFQTILAKQGVELKLSEGPKDLLNRIKQEHPELYAKVVPVIKHYIAIRYQKDKVSGSSQQSFIKAAKTYH